MSDAITPSMANRLEMWPVDRLIPYERNARTHSDEQVAQIKASILEFGFTAPILVDGEDGILAGHGRLQAARELELPEVPVIVLDHLTPSQRRAYILADNKLALNAGWDLDILSVEIEALKMDDFDLDLLGFSQYELDQMAKDAGWESDFDDPTVKDGSHTEGIEAKIVIRCGSIDREEVVNTIRVALEESGIEGVKIDD
jgi:hypothetical protein